MFYAPELLSLRRKGKLARCWLAATVSEKMFKQTCKPALIKNMDVSLICEEILSTIELRNGRKCGRFSLYLSSQLMYGVTKILFYQAKFFQEKCYITIISHRHKELNAAAALELPEVPPINELFRNLEVSSNLHLITEEPYTSVVEQMQGEMNFGVLSTYEMEKFLLPVVEGLSLLVFHIFTNSTILNLSNFIILSFKKTRLAFAKKDQHETLVVIEDNEITKHAPSTPKKRTLKSLAGTPTKKRKISPPVELVVPIKPSSVLLPEPVPEPVPICELVPEVQEILPDLLTVELTKVTKHKKRKFFDTQTKLSDIAMRKYISNVRAHTLEQYLFASTLPSAQEYLTRPSTKILNTLWGETLTKRFKQYLLKPIVVQDELQYVPDFEVRETIAGDTVRADSLSKLRDQTAELSSKIVITTTETTDPSRTLEKTLITEDYRDKERGELRKETKEFEESVVELPDISSFEEKIGYKLNV
ncbi:Meiotic recombination protein REC8 like protein [Habropoda laboriosa]|uniref:Meiotic recombination protein REC8 like protein n=1 Tax=Habropoda laboriosa TaxID=597456 RepID=A0A0L7RHH5_9HYME|nr:Meiotic recombination protein REC8 like protein [Habropoda laboriosa]